MMMKTDSQTLLALLTTKTWRAKSDLPDLSKSEKRERGRQQKRCHRTVMYGSALVVRGRKREHQVPSEISVNRFASTLNDILISLSKKKKEKEKINVSGSSSSSNSNSGGTSDLQSKCKMKSEKKIAQNLSIKCKPLYCTR